MAVADRYQPQAVVFNMGRPTIRWVGNEDGLAADPCCYVENGCYRPPECDVAIRRHWFWQPDDLVTLKSVEHILGIYYRSVGLGANLLLNVPPDREGLISAEDAPACWNARRASTRGSPIRSPPACSKRGKPRISPGTAPSASITCSWRRRWKTGSAWTAFASMPEMYCWRKDRPSASSASSSFPPSRSRRCGWSGTPLMPACAARPPPHGPRAPARARYTARLCGPRLGGQSGPAIGQR